MARAEPELRPCGIAAGYVVLQEITLRSSRPTFRSTRLQHSCASSTLSAMAVLAGIMRTLNCFPTRRSIQPADRLNLIVGERLGIPPPLRPRSQTPADRTSTN